MSLHELAFGWRVVGAVVLFETGVSRTTAIHTSNGCAFNLLVQRLGAREHSMLVPVVDVALQQELPPQLLAVAPNQDDVPSGFAWMP